MQYIVFYILSVTKQTVKTKKKGTWSDVPVSLIVDKAHHVVETS